MIILLLLLVKVIVGVPESPFIIPKSEKVIVKNIEDKSRSKETKMAIKSFMKEWHKKQKAQKKENKTTVKLLTDRDTDTTLLRERIDVAQEELRNYNEALADLRLDVMNLLTEEEWQTTLAQLSYEKPKKGKKRTKKELKAQLKQQQRFRQFRENLAKSYEGTGSKTESLMALDNFEQTMADLLFESQGKSQKVFEVMYDKSATKEEILSITVGYEQFKARSSEAILDLRNELNQISSDKTWTLVSKDLASFLSY